MKFPPWLRQKLPTNVEYEKTKDLLESANQHTVCEEAKCPNRFICYEKKCATFLALGKYCTRKCSFCDISYCAAPPAPDAKEPKNIALLAKKLGLKHIVITMVTRDDLPDQGANHIAKIIEEVRKENRESTIEVLTSDFQGKSELLDIIIKAKPHIFNHNIETTSSLSPQIRNRAKYSISLDVLKYIKDRAPYIHVKSGFMLGLGETQEEIKKTIKDLKEHGCDIVTIGQYLQSSEKCLKVKKYIPPEEFELYKLFGEEIGIKHMNCGPFVRSSFNADKFIS